MAKVKAIVDGAKSGWKKIDKKKRTMLIVVVVGIFILVSVYAYYTQRTEYVPLFTDLELSDAGTITNDLETKGIKYKLENEGRDILIDQELVDQYRLDLAMEGMMPENSTGFEIFDDTSMMATEEDRQIMYQRALTGELQRSIMSLDAVKSAKVNLVMPEKSIFEKEDKEASASVIIDVKSGHKITDDMVKGIAALVSGAVDNLPEKNIQIVDSKGNLLSAFLQEDDEVNGLDVATGYQEIQSQFEDELETNLNEMLGSAYGKDKVKISVYADLDFDSEESTVITYQEPALRSEQVTASGDNIQVDDTTGGNINDNVSNVVRSQDGAGSTYERTINNELDSTTTKTVKAPGKVNKLTTSVVYDGQLSNQDVQSIQNIVASATGYDAQRGDTITVEGVTFDTSYDTKMEEELKAIEQEEWNSKSFLEKYGQNIFFVFLCAIGVIVLIALIRLIFSKDKRSDGDLAGSQVAMDLQSDDKNGNDARETIIDMNNSSVNIETKSNEQEIKAKNYANDNPEIVADLIKTWMQE